MIAWAIRLRWLLELNKNISHLIRHLTLGLALVKIKERPELEKFFYKKKQDNDKGIMNISHNLYGLQDEIPPASYLIFSQEVSNCLNSYAKKFNFRHQRKGGIFADRYSKYLVETEQQMNQWIDRLNNMEKLVFFEEQWKVEEEFEFENSGGECSNLSISFMLFLRIFVCGFRATCEVALNVFLPTAQRQSISRLNSNFKKKLKVLILRGSIFATYLVIFEIVYYSSHRNELNFQYIYLTCKPNIR